MKISKFTGVITGSGKGQHKAKINREITNLFLFACGKGISLFGSAIYTFTLGLYILKTTGSGLSFATNLLLFTLPVIFIMPVAGVITDRVARKKIVVNSDLFSFLFLLLIYFISIKYGLTIPLIYLSTFILTVFACFNDIGIEAAKPEIVSTDKLININSISKLIFSSSHILGPVIGGIVYALVNLELFIIINSISFLLAAVLEYFIDYTYNSDVNAGLPEEKTEPAEGSMKGFWYQMQEGYKYIYSRKLMLGFVYIFVVLNFFTTLSFTVPIPYLLNTIWKIKAEIFGIIEGCFPVGMLLGAIVIKMIMSRIRYISLLKWIIPLMIIATVLLSLPLLPGYAVLEEVFILFYYGSIMLVMGILISWVDILLAIYYSFSQKDISGISLISFVFM
jgi:MFS family permease